MAYLGVDSVNRVSALRLLLLLTATPASWPKQGAPMAASARKIQVVLEINVQSPWCVEARARLAECRKYRVRRPAP